MNQQTQSEIEKIALFDLDNTLANFTGQMNLDLEKIRGSIERPFKLDWLIDPPPYLEERMNLIKLVPGWWRNLPILDDGFEILKLAIQIGFDPHILTKGPFRTTSAWEEKVIWCREKIDASEITKTPIKITITEDKGLVYGRVLVDDYPPYIERWLSKRPRGLVIIPDRDYNKDYSHPQVVRYNSSESSFREISEKMVETYKR